MAADYPVSAGMMNDFTGAIPEAVGQAIELRLRAYERATSNEVAVAVVSSLQGETMDQFASGLYRAWALGKPDRDNGVLIVWAAREGQARIQPGAGLEAILTPSACAEIAGQMAALFRQGNAAQAVQAAVDRVIQRLDAVGPVTPPPAPRPSLGGVAAIGGVGLLAVLLAIMIYHTARTHDLQRKVPAALARAEKSFQGASADSSEAAADFKALRAEAPEEVWQRFEPPMTALPDALRDLRAELDGVASQRREEYGELKRARRALRRWNRTFAKSTAVVDDLRKSMQQFCESRDQCLERIPRLASSLSAATQRVEETGEERSRVLCVAAGQTFDRVHELRLSPPVNWLLARDLMDDTQACLDCLEVLLQPGVDPKAVSEAAHAPRPPRSWPDSARQSPADAALSGLAAVVHTAVKDVVI